MRNPFTILSLALLVCACAENAHQEVPTYSVDVNQRDEPSTFFSSWDYIMLETNADCFLTNVSKARIDSQTIALLDRERIFLFNHEGKYEGKIDKLGRGAEEYLSIDDFCLHDSLVYTLSRAQKCISVYTRKGQFVRRVEIDDWYQRFEIVDDSLLFLCSSLASDQPHNFVLLNYRTGKNVASFDPFEEGAGVLFDDFAPFCGRDKEQLYVVHPFDYTIYTLTEEGISPYCKFQFNTKMQIDETASLVENTDRAKNQNIVKYLSSYLEKEGARYVTFDLFADEQGIGTYLCKIDASGEKHLIRFFEEFFPDFPFLFTPIVCTHDNALISVASAASVLNIEKMYNLSFFTDKGLTDENNHIVFIHKLK